MLIELPVTRALGSVIRSLAELAERDALSKPEAQRLTRVLARAIAALSSSHQETSN